MALRRGEQDADAGRYPPAQTLHLRACPRPSVAWPSVLPKLPYQIHRAAVTSKAPRESALVTSAEERTDLVDQGTRGNDEVGRNSFLDAFVTVR